MTLKGVVVITFCKDPVFGALTTLSGVVEAETKFCKFPVFGLTTLSGAVEVWTKFVIVPGLGVPITNGVGFAVTTF